MKLNQYELSIIGLIIIIFLALGYYTAPVTKPTSQKNFEQKIENAESYYNEAKAISLSMPLLNDTIIAIYADSLLKTLVNLNHDWVIYVKTHEDFEKYTEDVENLNDNLDGIRVRFHHELIMRSFNRTIQRNRELLKKWRDEPKKYETDGTNKFVAI